MMHRRYITIWVAVAFIWVIGIARAQNGGIVDYGAVVTGELTDAIALQTYTFAGEADDFVMFTVFPADRTLYPLLTLANAAGDPIATSGGDQGLFNRDAIMMAVRLPRTDVYTLDVGRVQGQGLYVLRVDGLPTADNVIPPGDPVLVEISPDAPFQTLQFVGGLLRLNATTPDFGFIAEVFSREGHIATLRGGTVQDVALSLPVLSNDVYNVVIYATNPTSSGQMLFFLEDVLAGDLPVVSASGCTVVIQGLGANVRTAPGIENDVITTLSARDEVPVLGRNEAWLKVQLDDGRVGWMFIEGGAGRGTCDALPILPLEPITPAPLDPQGGLLTMVDLPTSTPFIPTNTPTPPPTNTPTPPPSPTPTDTPPPTATFTPTLTSTPTLTPTVGATATPLATATAVLGGADATTVIDSMTALLDAQGGEVFAGTVTTDEPSDEIQWEIAVADAEIPVQMAFTCAGDNIQAVTFNVSIGTTPPLTYRCGEQISFVVTPDANNTGVVRVSAGSGETFANWQVEFFIAGGS